MSGEKNHNIDELVNKAVKSALKAGAAIMEVYGRDDFGVETKADNSPVTVADLQAHNIIAGVLGRTGLPLLSEEGRDIPFGERKAWRLFWLVDPLDGTKEFIRRNGEFTVNVALVEDGNPLAGVVYGPAVDVLYTGIAGRGAWRLDNASGVLAAEAVSGNDTGNRREPAGGAGRTVADRGTEADRWGGGGSNRGTGTGSNLDTEGGYAWRTKGVSLPCTSKKGYGIMASRSFPDKRTMTFIGDFSKKFSDTRIVARGSSLKLCMIAEGEADIYPRFRNISEWDTAAGHAIVLASGGRVVQAARPDQQLVYNKRESTNPWFIAFRNCELLDAVREMIPPENNDK